MAAAVLGGDNNYVSRSRASSVGSAGNNTFLNNLRRAENLQKQSKNNFNPDFSSSGLASAPSPSQIQENANRRAKNLAEFNALQPTVLSGQTPISVLNSKQRIANNRATRANEMRTAMKIASNGINVNAMRAEARKAMMRGKNFDRYNVVPLTFKGDGIGYSAGFGYNLNKGRSFGNFAKGFPKKYYRVYGNSLNNITQKVAKLRKNLDDTTVLAKTELEARKMEINKKKEELAKKAAADRKLKETIVETERALKQQERNAALAMMELERLESRVANNVGTSRESLESASRALILDFRRNIDAKLKNPEPGSRFEQLALAGKNSYSKLDQKTREALEKRFKLSPSFTARLRKGTRLSNTTARRLNRARYAVGSKPRSNYSFLKPKREGNYSGMTGSYTGEPLYTGTSNTSTPNEVAVAAPKKGFFSRVGNFFTRKNPPSARAQAQASA